jgi:hypothetical protein
MKPLNSIIAIVALTSGVLAGDASSEVTQARSCTPNSINCGWYLMNNLGMSLTNYETQINAKNCI